MAHKNVRTHKCSQAGNDKGIFDGQIVAMNEFGDGVIHGHRRTIKVVRTVVGDQVRVQLPQNDKSYVYGDFVKLLKPSGKRVDPKCRAFDDGCGGCQWLHFDYTEQLHWKTRILRDLLKQRCSSPIRVNDIIPMKVPFDYRNKMSLRNVNGHFVNMQDFDDKTAAPLNCRVETVPNSQARKILISLENVPHEILQAHLRSTEDGSIGMHLFVSRIGPSVYEFAKRISSEIKGLIGLGAQINTKYELLYGQNFLEYRDCGLIFNIPLNGFFQTNYIQARCLLDIVLRQLNIQKNDSVLDLYCGCGFFTLPVALQAKTVLGIENNASSTMTAHANARLNKLDNVHFKTADAAVVLRSMRSGDWPVVLLDPPRMGCDEAVVQSIIDLSPRRIVYVSCSPSSLARDLKLFLKASYTVNYCQPIDMFPHTVHMETVVTLTRS